MRLGKTLKLLERDKHHTIQVREENPILPRQTQPATRPGAQKTTARQQITQDNTPTDLTHTTSDEISLYTPHPIHTID